MAGSTHSRSQASLNFTSTAHSCADRMSELPQESEVIVEEHPQIVDPVSQHRESLDPHSKREAGVSLVVDADMLEHLGMNHSAPQHFKPAAVTAHPTTSALAHHTLDVHFGRRLGERKVGRAEAKR